MRVQENSYTRLFLDSIQGLDGLDGRLASIGMDNFMSLRRFLIDRGASQEELINLMDQNPFDNTTRGSKQVKVKAVWVKRAPEREYGFQICLLMGWDFETSVSFMNKVCAEPWSHWRNYREVIYDYCIRHHKGIGKAHSLIEEYQDKLNGFADIKRMDILDKYDDLTVSCANASSETPEMMLERLVALMEENLIPNYYLTVKGNCVQTNKSEADQGHDAKSEPVQEQTVESDIILIREDELTRLVPDGKRDELIALFREDSPFVRTSGKENRQDAIRKMKSEIISKRERFLQFCLFHQVKAERIIEVIGKERWKNMAGCHTAELFVLRFCVEQGIDSLMAYHVCNQVGRFQRNVFPGYTSLGKSLFCGSAVGENASSDESVEKAFKELMDHHLHIFSERRQTVLKTFRKILNEAPHHVRYYFVGNMPPNFRCYDNEEGTQIVQPSEGWLKYFPVEHLLEMLQIIDLQDDKTGRTADDPETSRATRMRQWCHGYENQSLPKREEFILCLLLIGIDSAFAIDGCLNDCGYAPLYARRHFDYVIMNLLKEDISKRADYKSLAGLFWTLWDDFRNNKEQRQTEFAIRDALKRYAKTLSSPSSRWRELNQGNTAAQTCLRRCMRAHGVDETSKNKAGRSMDKTCEDNVRQIIHAFGDGICQHYNNKGKPAAEVVNALIDEACKGIIS